MFVLDYNCMHKRSALDLGEIDSTCSQQPEALKKMHIPFKCSPRTQAAQMRMNEGQHACQVAHSNVLLSLRRCVHACGLRGVILVHLLLIVIQEDLISIGSPDPGIHITPLLQFAFVSLHMDRSGGGAMFIAFGRYKS